MGWKTRVLRCQTAFRVRSRGPIVLRKEHLAQVFALRGRIEECFELRHVEVEVDLVCGRELDSSVWRGASYPRADTADDLTWTHCTGSDYPALRVISMGLEGTVSG